MTHAPPPSEYRYEFPIDLDTVSDNDIIIVPVNPNGTTTIPDPDNWNKLIMLDFGAVPLTKFSLNGRGVNSAGIKARGVVGIGATLNLTGMNTNPRPNGTLGRGNDIFNVCFKSGAPAAPFQWYSRLDYAPVLMEYGDFIKTGTKITGTVPNWNVGQYLYTYFQKNKLRNGHWTWTAPDGNKNSHSDLFQSSLGGYGLLIVADCDVAWSGNGWYFLVSGNIQNAASGRTFGPNTCEFIIDKVNMSPSIPAPGSGLSVNPAQYFLQSGMANGHGGWSYPVASFGNSTALIEGRYTSFKPLDVWCRLGAGKPDRLTYFGFPDIPKSLSGADGVAFANFIAAVGKRPDGKGRAEGDRLVRFIGPTGTFPNTVVTDDEVGHLRAVRTKAQLRADLGFA